MMIRVLLILTAVIFSATAFAQPPKPKPPKVGNKPLVQVKPQAPIGCKLVGTVKGTKLWAGNCVGPELRGTTASPEMQTAPEPAPEASPPGQKE
jgi:hypothetical protein